MADAHTAYSALAGAVHTDGDLFARNASFCCFKVDDHAVKPIATIAIHMHHAGASCQKRMFGNRLTSQLHVPLVKARNSDRIASTANTLAAVAAVRKVEGALDQAIASSTVNTVDMARVRNVAVPMTVARIRGTQKRLQEDILGGEWKRESFVSMTSSRGRSDHMQSAMAD